MALCKLSSTLGAALRVNERAYKCVSELPSYKLIKVKKKSAHLVFVARGETFNCRWGGVLVLGVGASQSTLMGRTVTELALRTFWV